MSSKTLIIVESATKARTIKKFLGSSYQLQASNGHLIDLPKSKLGIDIEDNFTPRYITIRGKGEILKVLRNAGKKARRVLLATDPDREGEAICWHLAQAMSLDADGYNRIEFNEITAGAIKESLKNPRAVNHNRVDAQQTRRILDRVVGYKISPLLWKKVKKGLSAGRVQSVALRLICDREKEIEEFQPEEYWSIETSLTSHSGNQFVAALARVKGEKALIGDGETARRIESDLMKQVFHVEKVTRRHLERKPHPPYITSSLQQDASSKFGFSTRKTMQIAQQLYEGLDIGSKGTVGLVTYIRTDSVRISGEAVEKTQQYIKETIGAEFVPDVPHVYKSRRGAQEAHEAIRPTDVEIEPKLIKEYLSRDQFRLYELIWKRFVSSQMASAVLKQVRADISAGEYLLKATGSRVIFPGYMHISHNGKKSENDEDDKFLPELAEGEALSLQEINTEQHFTQPPPRYNEAYLVKMLEEKGIGRPSTYSPIIETIRTRGYVALDNKVFHPTELGKLVIDLLKDYFPEIIDVEFTAKLEEKLDYIEEGRLNGQDVLQEFYNSFKERLIVAEEQMEHVELEPDYSDESCPQCERILIYKHSRFGRFLACPGFPDCRYTKNIKVATGVKCPLDGGEIIEKRSRRGRRFYSCDNYPECNYSLWQKPLPENCPRCSNLMVEGGKNKSPVCSDADCRAAENKMEASAPGS